jgi:hypothetical protein
VAYWTPPSRCVGACSAVSSVEWALLWLDRFGRSRVVRRRVLGVGSRFFPGL